MSMPSMGFVGYATAVAACGAIAAMQREGFFGNAGAQPGKENRMLKSYQSHKIVQAAKIERIEPCHEDCPDEKAHADLFFVGGGEVRVFRDYLSRHKPQVGGYYVKYRDDYASWSPAKEFEDGYDELKAGGDAAEEKMVQDFGWALRQLKANRKVARTGWNGNGMWLSLTGARTCVPAENFWSEPNREYAKANGGWANVLPAITMKTASGEILMGWLASQTDMLATDWELVA